MGGRNLRNYLYGQQGPTGDSAVTSLAKRVEQLEELINRIQTKEAPRTPFGSDEERLGLLHAEVAALTSRLDSVTQDSLNPEQLISAWNDASPRALIGAGIALAEGFGIAMTKPAGSQFIEIATSPQLFPSVPNSTSSLDASQVTSHTISLPTGRQVSELLLVYFYTDETVDTSPTWPSGWTAIFDEASVSPDKGRKGAAWRVVDGTEVDTITVTTTAATTSNHIALRIKDAGDPTVDAPEATTSKAGGGVGDPPLLVVSSGLTKRYLFIASLGRKDEDVTAAPSGYENFVRSNGVDDLAVATKESLAEREDPEEFTGGVNQPYIAATVVIHPAVAATHSSAADAHHRPTFDKIIAPGEDLAGAFDDGSRSVLIQNGIHTLTGGFTIPADGHLIGQSRSSAIINAGANQIAVTLGGLVEHLTIGSGTHATGTCKVGGTVSEVTFDGNGRAVVMDSVGRLAFSLFINWAGSAGDYYVQGGNATILWGVQGCSFDMDALGGSTGGPAITFANQGLAAYVTFKDNLIYMNDAPAYPSIDVGTIGTIVQGVIISGNRCLTNNAGTPGANGGFIDVGANASQVSIANNILVPYGSATAPPFAIRTATRISATGNDFGHTENGIELNADGCRIIGNAIGSSNEAAGTNTDGILIDGDDDKNILLANVITGFTTGINISSPNADSNVVAMNILDGNTTPLTDSGTNTKKSFNVTV